MKSCITSMIGASLQILMLSGLAWGSGPNFLPNGGFEDGVMRRRVDGRYPDLVAYYSPSLYIDTKIAHSGLKSLRIGASLDGVVLEGEAGGSGVVEGMPGKHYTQGLVEGEYLIVLYSRTQEVRPGSAVIFSYQVLDAHRNMVSSGRLGAMPQDNSSFIENWRQFHNRVQVPYGGIVQVKIAAVDDGRVGYTWVDGVSVTKMDEGESIPTAKVATSLSVSARDGRPLPIFTN